MDEESARKAAKNEALSRSLNEGLARGEEKWPSADPTRFILAPGHNDPQIELVVEEADEYQIVEKIGPGREEVL